MAERREVIEEQAVRDAAPAYLVKAGTAGAKDVSPGYKRTEVGVIPNDWQVLRVGDIAAKVGSGVTPRGGNRVYRASGRPFVRSQNVAWGCLDLDDIAFIDEATHSTFNGTELKDGDVLLNITGASIGRAAIADERVSGGNVNQHVCIIRPDRSALESGFLSAFLISSIGQRQIDSFQAGGNRQGLNFHQVRSFSLPLPSSLLEQRAIATALSDADALIESLDRLIAKKRAIKQAAMQQLLTGQTRLPGFTGEWETKRLGDVVDRLVGGGTPSRSNPAFWGDEIPWVTVKDFATFNPRDTQESITRLGLNNSASHLIPAGTPITSTRMALGKAVVFDVDVAINQDLKAVFLKPSASVAFLIYWFECNARMIDDLGSGSTVKGISMAQLAALPFPSLSLAEQTAIATVLSDMDTEIEALEHRRDKARQIKQGMMQELLTGRTRLA
jgi:type I restriction enzyme S subunit